MPQGVTTKEKEEYYNHLVQAENKFRHSNIVRALEIDEDLYFERK
jgi:hypothetical protein